MNPAEIIRRAKLDGVNLALSGSGKIAASGEYAAIARWTTTLKASKPEILAYLANEEVKVRQWLESIGEDDPVMIEDVLSRCREEPEALAYFLNRSSGGLADHGEETKERE